MPTITLPIASLFNLAGPDVLIILLFAFLVISIVVVISIVRFLPRSQSNKLAPSTPEERLRKLDSMLSTGAITESEYQRQRIRIVSEI